MISKLVTDYTQGTVQLDFPFAKIDKSGIVQYCKSQMPHWNLHTAVKQEMIPLAGNVHHVKKDCLLD